jgi:hypothetical protein
MTRFDPTAARQLEYAARSKSLRRRRMLVLVGVTILLCAVTPFAVRYAKMGAERMRVNRVYRQCAAYTPPASQPVWEEDRERIKPLRDYALVGSHNGDAAYHVPENWRQLNAAIGQQIQSWGTLYLHERRASGTAPPRLVGVDIAGWSRGGPVVLFARVRTIAPAAPLRLPQQERLDHPSVKLAPTEGPVRLLAGQAHPNDPSHFTIDYSVGQHAGVIDGWLKDDGRVLLEPRTP